MVLPANSSRRQDWFWNVPIFEVTELGDYLHLLGASRPNGVRYSLGCVQIIGFESGVTARNNLKERMAQRMFEADENSREVVARIPRMTWEDVGEQYRNNWRERADVALTVIEEDELAPRK